MTGGDLGTAPKADHCVGVAEMALVQGRSGSITTHALGSCIGLTVFDRAAGVGGLLHFMLPKPMSDEQAAGRAPEMFGSKGIPLLFRRAYELGASKENMVVCAAGGAGFLNDDAGFLIGRRNKTLMRKLFWKSSVVLAAEDTGGCDARTMSLDLETGRVTVRIRREETVLWTP